MPHSLYLVQHQIHPEGNYSATQERVTTCCAYVQVNFRHNHYDNLLSHTQAPCHGLRGHRVTVSRAGAMARASGKSEITQDMSEIHASDMCTISRRCAITALLRRLFTHLIALFMIYFFVSYIKKEVFIPHFF